MRPKTSGDPFSLSLSPVEQWRPAADHCVIFHDPARTEMRDQRANGLLQQAAGRQLNQFPSQNRL